MKILTALEIIDETAEYYKADTSRRGKKEKSGCTYYTIKGDHIIMCAVGRCMTEKYREVYMDNGDAADTIKPVIDSEYPADTHGGIDFALQPQYHGQIINFWMDLQDFHDTDSNWDDNGLTISGNFKLGFLKEKYKN